MKQTLDHLARLTPDLPPKLKAAARVILDNPSSVATTSMRALAKQAKVTPPTMARLSKFLGFARYSDFKNEFKQAIHGQNFQVRATSLKHASLAGDEAGITQQMVEAGQKNIDRFASNVADETLIESADLILKANNTYVVGAGAMHWMAGYMQFVARMAVPNLRVPRSDGVDLVEGLALISKNDVMVVFSFEPYSKQAIEAANYAVSRGAKLITMTDSKAAPLVKDSSINIFLSTASPQFFPSLVSVVTALETLVAMIVARSGDTAIDRIKQYEKMRSEKYLSR